MLTILELNAIRQNNLMRQYFKHGKLSLMDIGFSLPDRIFISDNLSKLNNAIHKEALRLKKLGKIKTVNISSGFVHVQLPDSNKSSKIASVKELSGLFD